MQAYADIQTFSDQYNYGILRTLTHLEPDAYWEPCQRSAMKRFVTATILTQISMGAKWVWGGEFWYTLKFH